MSPEERRESMNSRAIAWGWVAGLGILLVFIAVLPNGASAQIRTPMTITYGDAEELGVKDSTDVNIHGTFQSAALQAYVANPRYGGLVDCGVTGGGSPGIAQILSDTAATVNGELVPNALGKLPAGVGDRDAVKFVDRAREAWPRQVIELNIVQGTKDPATFDVDLKVQNTTAVAPKPAGVRPLGQPACKNVEPRRPRIDLRTTITLTCPAPPRPTQPPVILTISGAASYECQPQSGAAVRRVHFP
jgi:hypothetical protein